MIFSEQLMIYTRIRIRYSSKDDFLYIMRYLTDILNNNEIQSKDEIMLMVEDFAALQSKAIPAEDEPIIEDNFEW